MDNAEAIIKNNEIRCPICNKKIGNITGNEKIINFRMQCPRKIKGIAHEFTINIERGV